MAVEMAKMLSTDTGRAFPATMVFTYSTVAAIAAHLLDELFPQVAVEAEGV
jgi:hypothetical protein